MIKSWFFEEAKWYQFWFPQSGLLGSMLMGVSTTTVAVLLFSFVAWR
jgi:hypothetical protein